MNRLFSFPFLSRRLYAAKFFAFAGLLAFASQVCLASNAPGENQQITQLLRAMDENAATLSYSGTLVYSQGDRMQTLRRFHTVKDGQRHERLVHLSGRPRETIRQGEKITCLAKGEAPRVFQQDAVADTLSRAFASSLLSETSAYTVELAGQTRVAGRDAIRLRLLPQDDYRYEFLLALDRQSKLLLQSLMLNEQRDVLERFEYLDIQIGEAFDLTQLEPAIAAQPGSEPINPASTSVATKALPRHGDWVIGWKPPGFMAQSASSASPLILGGGSQPRGSMTFGDGLSAFSVFVADSVNLGNQTLQRGATTAHTQVKKHGDTVYSVTVVGEIPVLAARKIASSVEFKR